MTGEIAVSRVTLVTHCHATEDLDKVEQALLNTLPPNMRNSVTLLRDRVKGFYGNVIDRLTVVLEGEQALNFFKYLIKMLSDTDKSVLLNTLDMRYDRKSNELYLRLSKQEAYLGMLTLYDGDDVIRVSVSFSIKKSLKHVQEFVDRIIKGVEDDRQSLPSV